jgi:DNA-binding NarL/FixJ family response regulator
MSRQHLRAVVVGCRASVQREFCAGLAGIGIQAFRRANTAAGAVEATVAEHVDVCLVDADMPGDALAVVTTIARHAQGTPVVMLGDAPSDQDLLDAVEAGASGYLSRHIAPARLEAALRDVSTGRSGFPRRLSSLLVANLRAPSGRDRSSG